jgi:hypothetical protein
LRKVRRDASLADATSSIPWIPLTLLFDALADIRGVGFSKMTKALHRKRPALIPTLDNVVQAYLTRDDPGTRSSGSFGERATALVRSYKRDLDRNRSVLHELQRELASREYRLTEVRILDLLIWAGRDLNFGGLAKTLCLSRILAGEQRIERPDEPPALGLGDPGSRGERARGDWALGPIARRSRSRSSARQSARVGPRRLTTGQRGVDSPAWRRLRAPLNGGPPACPLPPGDRTPASLLC